MDAKTRDTIAVGKNNNIIEINGKRYDARTGDLLSSAGAPAIVHPQAAVTTKAAPRPATVKAIPVHDVAAPPAAAPKPDAQPKAATKIRVHEAVKQAAQPRPGHKQQSAKTLMRSAVQKPSASLRRRAKAHGHVDALADKPAARLQPKASVHRLDDKRLQHARSTPKSQAVSRFSKRDGPAAEPPTSVNKPVALPQIPVHHRPAQTNPSQTHHQAAKAKAPRTTADILEHALQQATSHEQAFFEPKKRRRVPSRLASVTMVSLGLLVLGGFVAYQNINSVKLHIASSKAGFTASLPDYQPAGYHLSHLNYAPGAVALDFQSNSDGRAYAITERTSGWSSDALRDSFLASSGQDYQAIESAGRTVFLYGQNAATWVSGGVWYQVEGNGTLSDRQLVQLAASM